MSQPKRGVDLDTSLGYLLKQAASVLRSEMDTALRPLGVSLPQYACLELLAQRPGLSASELARGSFVSRQSMNVLLQAMERDGLVSRPDRPVSGRVLPFQLTEAGRRVLDSASTAAKAVDDRMGADLDAADRAHLHRLLEACISSLSGP